MPRYLMANRRSGQPTPRAAAQALEHSIKAFNVLFAESVDVLHVKEPAHELDRRIVAFEADDADVAAKRELAGRDVIVEPAIPHVPFVLPLDLQGDQLSAGDDLAGRGDQFRCRIVSASKGLIGATVLLHLRSAGGARTQLRVTTGEDGEVSFEFGDGWAPAALVVYPAGKQWPMLVREPTDGLVVDAPALPDTGPRAWWHEVLGLRGEASGRGAEVTIGVIDTGAGPHPDLTHVETAGSFILLDHEATTEAGLDISGHGTHVVGIIAARPSDLTKPVGLAPDARVVTARVFQPGGEPCDQGDVADAIDHLAHTVQADIINLSLGASTASEIEHDAVLVAAQQGTLCVCAAANNAGPVQYPAAFPETVAVSALGLEGWAPGGTLSASRCPEEQDRYGAEHLFLANFSSYGPEISCAGPGVGVISTWPDSAGQLGRYAACDGTSIAAPAIAGLLAAILSDRPDYMNSPRDASRSDRARSTLRAACRTIGLAAVYEGAGVPRFGG